MSYFATPARLVKARKEHKCVAYEVILESGYGELDFTTEEWHRFQSMKLKGGKIQAGEIYLFWSGFCDGEVFTSRANIDMESIVSHYEWWDEL